MGEVARRDVEGRAHRVVGVVDDDLARLGRGVGIAQLLDLRDRAALGGQDVDCASGSAWHEADDAFGPLDHAFVRRGPAPGQLGVGDHEHRTGGDLENRARRLGL
jgi:hypothetical protein